MILAAMGTNPISEQARLQHLVKLAAESQEQTAEDFDKTQLDAGTQRTQFFEKLAIGSGATIAALVSFLGTQHSSLHPHWILRCSLVSLAVALVAALYRNFRYPNYILAVDKRLWMAASKLTQERKNDVLQAQDMRRPIYGLQTGRPIDLDDWTPKFNKSDSGLKGLIDKELRREKRLMREWRTAEKICLRRVSTI
jgi:hypothetical protein